jgi:phage major head subunit gpT-like protein
MIINRGTLGAFFTGLNTAFQQAFDSTEVVYPNYAMAVPSSTAQEQYAWLGMLPGLREWVGDRVIANLRSYDFTIRNKAWERTIGVLRDHLEDDTYGIYSPMAAMLGNEARRHPQELLASLLQGGFTQLCYDGQPFFNANHPTYNDDNSVSLVSNTQGGAGAAWFLMDDSRPIKPLILQTRKPAQFVRMDSDQDERNFMAKELRYSVDWRGNVGYGLWQLAYASRQTLDATNYESARAAMMGMNGDNGRKLGLQPRLLVVGPSNEAAAKRVVLATQNAAGATNVNANTARIVVDPYLV